MLKTISRDERDTLQRTPPVTWRRWVTLTCGITLRVNRIGLMRGFRLRASIPIEEPPLPFEGSLLL
jgi:hypothetical protein